MPATARSTAKKPARTTAAKKNAASARQSVKAPLKKTADSAATPAPKRAAPAKRRHAIPSEQRRHYIEVAAYFIAERHGFMPGRELADWTAAEAEIDRLLAEGRLSP
jgi:hypothetical protein